ncbi:hypothetical protein COCHEDRAFT_1227317 [Bipolaris maydis C5]|uniref:BZIP domain-containing protein n=3 Tax=Cochliobolus heterostrophus TaxID=5016 RepID=M2SRZ3_COCH5|nr:hypothetical protein COCHEDRAFT_1227317 [Bipolaris maydis C5]KAH7552295.1 hypothetical protein BM1_09157 [Bipolaris maydis]KAJ5024344.1 hypothetical protein J3E73DRAFT_383604 [Bipolaris maydis]KAJ6207061.1 hypothetical protein PSV09DRAFT_1227317 [Bipolaris maydis]KAJ6278679.1 hypothetical protein J3E71DRAFT_355687 [Bipolaris maydis]
MQYTSVIMQFGISADWQLGPSYSGPQDNNHLIDTSLLATSSASTGNLIVPDASLYPTADFNLFPTGNSPYLGHDFQLFPQGHGSLSTTGDTIDTLAMAQSMKLSNNMDAAAHMTRDDSQSGSSWTSRKDRSSSSPEHVSSSKTSSTKSSPVVQEAASRIEKRKANTLAARRYRQKRVDQMSTLEAELKEIKAERDELKVRNARLEGEVETLRALLRAQK